MLPWVLGASCLVSSGLAPSFRELVDPTCCLEPQSIFNQSWPCPAMAMDRYTLASEKTATLLIEFMRTRSPHALVSLCGMHATSRFECSAVTAF